jgi:hypothetical protein
MSQLTLDNPTRGSTTLLSQCSPPSTSSQLADGTTVGDGSGDTAFNGARKLKQWAADVNTMMANDVYPALADLASTAIPSFTQVNTSTTFSQPQGLDQETDNVGRTVYNGKVSLYQPTDPYDLIITGIALIDPPNYSMGNNGAITLSVAIDLTYANAFIYLPAGGIFSGSEHGIYYVQMSSTTVGQVFNNKYIGGQPKIPASPTAFVSTGPGAVTMPGTSVFGWQTNLPPNGMGANGNLEIHIGWTAAGASGQVKGVSHILAGANILGSDNQTGTTVFRSTINNIRNRGVTNAQVAIADTSGDIGTGTAPNTGSVDTTMHQPLSQAMNNAQPSTGWIVIQHYRATVKPSHRKDTGHTPLQTVSSATIIPPGAAALGLTGANSKWFITPTAADVLYSATPDTTHNLYEGQFYNSKPPYGTSHVSTVGGLLALNFGTIDTNSVNVRTVNQSSGTVAGSYGVLPLIDATKSFYVEAAITLSDNDQDHFPGFYLDPVEHDQGNNTFIELDIDEAGNDKDSNNPFYGSVNTYISWVSGVASPTNNDSGGLSGTLYGPNLDRTQEHIFGISYDAVNHVIRWWVDGVVQPLIINATLPSHHYYGVFDTSSHGANKAYSMYVRYLSAFST